MFCAEASFTEVFHDERPLYWTLQNETFVAHQIFMERAARILAYLAWK